MPKCFVFTNVIGSFAFDEGLALLGKGEEKGLMQKYSAEKLPRERIKEILHHFKRSDYFSAFREANLAMTRQQIRESVKDDLLIIQAINSLDDMNRAANTLVKRLREWYELYCPEISRKIQDHGKFTEVILKSSREEILKGLKLRKNATMGGELSRADIKAVERLAAEINGIYRLKAEQEKYLEELMKRCCPNVMAITGSLIGAKLISHAGSLERLAGMPSSTVQLLGAEKALFRHVKTGARSPKHGLIVQHTYFTRAKSKDYGRIARLLSDKISIAAKVDYFRGKFVGDMLRRQIEKKLAAITG
jgi:nucleolar protein 56